MSGELPKITRPTMTVILSGFAIAGGLAAASIFLPDNALKVAAIITAVIGGIFGFIAGRKS